MICASFNVFHAQIVTNLAWRSKLGLFHIAHPCSPLCLRFKLLYQWFAKNIDQRQSALICFFLRKSFDKRIFCAFMCWRLYVGSGKEAYNIRCEKQKLSGDQDHVLWHVVHMFISFANRYNAVFFNLPSFSDN